MAMSLIYFRLFRYIRSCSSQSSKALLLLSFAQEIIENFYDISTTLVKNFIAYHSLSQSPQIPRADNLILLTQ